MQKLFTDSLECKVLRRLCDRVGSPLSHRLLDLISQEGFEELVSTYVDPNGYSSAADYLADAQLVALLSKHANVPTGINRKAVAQSNFEKAERICFQTNLRLSPLLCDPLHYGDGVSEFISHWRRKIRWVLGVAPKKSDLSGKFGPGSTLLNVGSRMLITDKLHTNFTSTPDCFKHFSQLFYGSAWGRHCLRPFETESLYPMSVRQSYKCLDLSTSANRFTTVPKNAKTDRGICIEPSFNVYVQLGIGTLISRRLKRRFGWDKESIQKHHRALAQFGSANGSLATVDLSMASDTVSEVLVKLLLPPDWFDLLDQSRCRFTLFSGRRQLLEKFSSMGNGYTFELETLLFYTLAITVAECSSLLIDPYYGEISGYRVSAYGDDLIVPDVCASDLVSALAFFGFTVNREKTFTKGPFRESCGGDFFDGHPVRPFFVRKSVEEPHHLITLHNGLKRSFESLHACGDKREFGVLRYVAQKLPSSIRRCRGPSAFGDLVLQDDDPLAWSVSVRNSIRYLRVWRPVGFARENLEDHYPSGVIFAYALYQAGKPSTCIIDDLLALMSGRGTMHSPRVNGSYVRGYRFGRIPYS